MCHPIILANDAPLGAGPPLFAAEQAQRTIRLVNELSLGAGSGAASRPDAAPLLSAEQLLGNDGAHTFLSGRARAGSGAAATPATDAWASQAAQAWQSSFARNDGDGLRRPIETTCNDDDASDEDDDGRGHTVGGGADVGAGHSPSRPTSNGRRTV